MMEIRGSEGADPRYDVWSLPRSIRFTIIPAVLALSLLFSGLYVYTLIIWPEGARGAASIGYARSDFILPYSAALLALDGAPEKAFDYAPIHAKEKQVSGDLAVGMIPWAYPPFYQLAIMPLSRLSYISAFRAFVLMNLALLAIVVWHIYPGWHTLLLLLIFPAAVFSTATGQNGNLSAALIGAGLLLLKRKPIASGIAFGLLAYKPHLAVAIPFCLFAGKYYRTLAATALTALATVMISVVAFGQKPLFAFLTNLSRQAGVVFNHPGELWQRMPTVMVLMLQMTGNQVFARITQSVVSIISLAVVAWIWRQSSRREWIALALVASTPLITPYFFDYDMALFAIPLFFLVREVAATNLTYTNTLIMAALWLAPPVVFLRRIWFPELWQIGPIVCALLLGFVAYQVARDRSLQS
jgi:hypothetical protein